MRSFLFAALITASFVLAQSDAFAARQENSKHDDGQATIQGCVGRSSGDYILTEQDPAMSYELQATGKVRLRHYLGQQVEVTGEQGPTLSSSSDALNKTGSASAVTITVRSIKTIDKECVVQ